MRQPIVVTVACDIQRDFRWYAEGVFSGKLIDELAGVRATLHYDPGHSSPSWFLETYHDTVVSVAVRDGAAAVECGTNADKADSVTFVLP